MKRFALAALLPLLAASPAPSHLAGVQPGVYKQIDTVTKKPLGGGSQMIVVAGKGGKLGFSLNATRQVDTNQGFIAGVIPASLPYTWTRTAASGNCRIRFEAVGKGLLKLTQDTSFGNCGFGYGVTADGTYAVDGDRGV